MTNYGCQPFSAYLCAVAAMRDNNIKFLILLDHHMHKSNGQTVILVPLLIFVVDSMLACTLIKCFELFVAPLPFTQVMSYIS